MNDRAVGLNAVLAMYDLFSFLDQGAWSQPDYGVTIKLEATEARFAVGGLQLTTGAIADAGFPQVSSGGKSTWGCRWPDPWKHMVHCCKSSRSKKRGRRECQPVDRHRCRGSRRSGSSVDKASHEYHDARSQRPQRPRFHRPPDHLPALQWPRHPHDPSLRLHPLRPESPRQLSRTARPSRRWEAVSI